MTDALKTGAKAFSAVPGDQNQPFAGVKKTELFLELGSQSSTTVNFLPRREQGINYGIAGNVNVRLRDAFSEQVIPGRVRGCKM